MGRQARTPICKGPICKGLLSVKAPYVQRPAISTVAAHSCILQPLVCMWCHVSLCLDLFLTGKIKRVEWRSLNGRL